MCEWTSLLTLRVGVSEIGDEGTEMPRLARTYCWLIATVLLGTAWLRPELLRADDAVAEQPVDYVKQIKPVLRERCYACHGALKQEAGLRLDTVALVTKGGENGAVVDVREAVQSLILKRVTATVESERMPPEGEPLSAAQLGLLKAWIAQGAKGPADEQPERDPRDHWAFQTPVRPAVPQDVPPAWSRNPIDAFLAASHRQHGLQPQRLADKRVWLRRVSLDLVGLPPTRAELDAFVADMSEQAHEAVVTRLLDSPQYGERWGRHWMDVWRYSDWWGLGAEVRNSQKHIWHWRDWIIESLNADKGYDQMLREMLAADELYPNDLDRLRASGFLARQYFKFNRTSWLDETVEHTSKAMLGLTFNCAKCHDHKYDPIAQTDYYKLRAIFEPYQVRTDLLPGETDYERNGLPRGFDCNLDAQTFLHIRGDDRNPDKSRVMDAAVPAFLSRSEWKIAPVTLPHEAYQPGIRPFIVDDQVKIAEQKIATARTGIETARKKLNDAEAALDLAKKREAAERLAAALPADALRPAHWMAIDGLPFLVKDDFSAERPDVWEQLGGRWAYANGKLVQSADGAERVALQLKRLPPENFEATVRFQTTGGQMWKSVGITFDVVGEHEFLAYLSAYADGSKSQVAFKSGANYEYPPNAAQARKVELNQPQVMTLRVRDTLVNVLINGELSIAYRLPQPRRPGAIQLITFDARAEFTSFELKELSPEVALSESKSGTKPNATSQPASVQGASQQVAHAKLGVTLAEKSLAIAETQPATLRARAAALAARHQQPTPDNASELARAAVKWERITAVAQAEEAAVQAELDLVRVATDKQAEAEKKLLAARTVVETTRAAVEMPGENFTPLNGALKTLENNLETEDSRRKPFPTTSTGRRTALAKWITDPRHPLPARVAVNHVWLRHFGRPLVPTVFDFGRKGTPPTHPELLDWLAVELVEHNWSLKHIHRLIVTSQAYRMSSSSAGATVETLAADPDNRFYWRANPIRMEAQLVRDSLLHLAGELDLTRGGPSIPASDETSKRRSLYFVHSHNEHQKFLSMFDDANVLDCYRRAESIVPQQALALENSPLATAMGEKIAQRLLAAQPMSSDTEFIRTAFVTVLAVEPSSEELALATEGLIRLTTAAQQKNRPNPAAHARASLIQALLNHNDFVTIR